MVKLHRGVVELAFAIHARASLQVSNPLDVPQPLRFRPFLVVLLVSEVVPAVVGRSASDTLVLLRMRATVAEHNLALILAACPTGLHPGTLALQTDTMFQSGTPPPCRSEPRGFGDHAGRRTIATCCYWRARPGSNRRVRALQARAFPLGYLPSDRAAEQLGPSDHMVAVQAASRSSSSRSQELTPPPTTAAPQRLFSLWSIRQGSNLEPPRP